MFEGVIIVITVLFISVVSYHAADVIAQRAAQKLLENAVVILAAGSLEEMWNCVLSTRTHFPHTQIIVLCESAATRSVALEASLQNVTFVTQGTIEEAVCAALLVPKK